MQDRDKHVKITVLIQNNVESNALTRESIETALIQLMQEKSFRDITITDICKRAGVSRNAYYRNYSSKEDILEAYVKNLIDEMVTVLRTSDPIHETIQSWHLLLGVVQKYASHYKILLQAGYEDRLREEYIKHINQGVLTETYQNYYSNVYWVSAISGLIAQWVKDDMQVPLEQLASLGAMLMTEGIKTIEVFEENRDEV